jgi:hypothetical protein
MEQGSINNLDYSPNHTWFLLASAEISLLQYSPTPSVLQINISQNLGNGRTASRQNSR